MSVPATFGWLLRQLRTSKGISQEELAQRLNMSLPSVIGWEIGERRPEGEVILKIKDVLGLSIRETNQLLRLAEYPLLTRESPEVASQAQHHSTESDDSVVTVQLSSIINPEQQIAVQYRDIETGLNTLSTLLQREIPLSSSILPEITNGLKNVEQSLKQIKETTERRDEEQDANNVWSNAFTLSIGGVSGILINVITGGEMKDLAWVVLIILLLVTLFAGWKSFKRRTQHNKAATSLRD